MRFSFFLITALTLLFAYPTTNINSQQVIRFTTERASTADDALYRDHFAHYTLGKLATKETSDLLRSKNFFESIQIIAGDMSFTFSLQAHDLRPEHYKLRYADDNGIHEHPRTPNKTYKGYSTQGFHPIRITADDEFFNALLKTAHDEFYIEHANKIVKNAPSDLFVLYWGTDNLKRMEEHSCGLDHNSVQHQYDDNHENPAPPTDDQRMAVCRVVQVALANDFEMFQEKGSVTAVENHNLAVINNVETNYDDEFAVDLQFDIVEIYVAASGSQDPWTNSTDPGDLLDDFTDWGPSGFSNQHDVGGLWTNRNFNGDVIGLAWLDAVCTGFRYHTVQDFSNNAGLLKCLQAHEMGHNFGSNHDPAGSTTIMAPSVQITDAWSNSSINQINSYINSINCLALCGSGAPPIADFTANPTSGCVPLVVHYTDLSDNNPTSWSWTFQGGSPSSSTLANPTVTYNNPGTFDVTLTVTNALGSNTISMFDFIEVNDDPVADFDYNIDELVVDFENFSDNGTTYLWNFGDGHTSTAVNPTHEYEEDGLYTVTLTVTNECGTDTYTVVIEIITLPIADFDASPREGCDPLEVDFINYSSENATSFQWSFPGGSPPSSTLFEPTVVYEIPGTYNVTLTAFNELGEDIYTRTNYITVFAQPFATFTVETDGLEANFNSTGSIGDTYSWNFGDGNTSSSPNPTHIYEEGGNYNVTLTVTNDCGTDITSMTVNITGAPVAQFSATNVVGCAPMTVQFTNLSSGIVTSFNWVFQGGSPATSTLANPTVTYNTPGTYDVTLTVNNNAGSDTEVKTDYITVLAAPVSDFDYIINGSQVVFTNESSNSTNYTWNFGDGNFGDDENPVHVYDEEGTYTVILTSTGPCGTDTSSATFTIANLPFASFTFNQVEDCAPATVQFFNQSSENATAFKWTFEGGSPNVSNDEDPVVIYNTPGVYDVQLIVYAPAGNDTMDMFDAISIGNPPNANFLFTTNGTIVEFENLSTNANSFEWQFGDGEISFEQDPDHTYSDFGSYTILLLAGNSCGVDTHTVNIVLGSVPNAFFTYSTHNGCAPFQVQFIDQSQNNPTQWLWTFDGGDPATSSQQNPLVTYAVPGSYPVTLQVTNANGTDVISLVDLIQVANPPNADFTYDLVLNTVSLNYAGTDYDSLLWEFGDGRTDNSLNPVVSYDNPGNYTISLIVFNACGSDTATVDVPIMSIATENPTENTSGWRIQPNPFFNKLVIYGEPLTAGQATVTLLDVHGKLLAQQPIHYDGGPVTQSLDARSFPAGMILIQIRESVNTVVLKGIHQE